VSDHFQNYSRRLSGCLLTYQFIELSLRLCLYRCHAIVKFRLDGHLPYEAPIEALEDAALGRLIDWYKVFTTNQALIQNLRKIKTERDHLAYQGYLVTLEEQENDTFLIDKARELEAAHQRAKACQEQLQVEVETTDRIVNEVYAALRTKRLGDGKALPDTPPVEGIPLR
jgi:hypothetical protein